MNFIAQLLLFYRYLLFARVIMSWFPVSRGGAMEQIYNLLYQVTEPVLGPLRRALPPLGGFDLSPIVAFFALQLLSQAIAR